jgi:hypothetical protein
MMPSGSLFAFHPKADGPYDFRIDRAQIPLRLLFNPRLLFRRQVRGDFNRNSFAC